MRVNGENFKRKQRKRNMENQMKIIWRPAENGETIGTVSGSEGGTIINEEILVGETQNTLGGKTPLAIACGALGDALITLEKCGNTSFAITCGIYGLMVHTVYFNTHDEALQNYDKMKQEIRDFIITLTDYDDIFEDYDTCGWCERFVNKYS